MTLRHAEITALAKHNEIMALPNFGLRLLDHNLTDELVSGNAVREGLHAFRIWGQRPGAGFQHMMDWHFGRDRFGPMAGNLIHMTDWGKSPFAASTTHQQRYAGLLSKYYGIPLSDERRKRPGPRPSDVGYKNEWDEWVYPDYYVPPIGLPERLKKKAGKDAFIRFYEDVNKSDFSNVAIHIPKNKQDFQRLLDSLKNPIQSRGSMTWQEWTAYEQKLAYQVSACLWWWHAPHHADTLRRLMNEPSFGKAGTQKGKALRAVAYFLEDAETMKPRLGSRKELELLHRLVSGVRPKTIETQHDTPYSYNAAAIIHSSKLGQDNPYGRDWASIVPHEGNPIFGFVILEPSLAATREFTARVASWFRNRPQDAFPVYDWKGRLFWPSISTMRKAKK